MAEDQRDDEKLPAPGAGAKMSPEMAGGPSIYDRMSKLAGGGGSPEDAAQQIMSAAEQLMAAAESNPALRGPVMRAIQIIKEGVEQVMKGGAATPQMRGTARRGPPSMPGAEMMDQGGGMMRGGPPTEE
jgi:hypothetical protein